MISSSSLSRGVSLSPLFLLFALFFVAASAEGVEDQQPTFFFPTAVRCDLGPYLFRKPSWTDPSVGYAHLPPLPATLEWDLVLYTDACSALIRRVPYRGSVPASGSCKLYPRSTNIVAPHRSTGDREDAEGAVWLLEPYLYTCGRPEQYVNNEIYYDFSGGGGGGSTTTAATAFSSTSAGATQSQGAVTKSDIYIAGTYYNDEIDCRERTADAYTGANADADTSDVDWALRVIDRRLTQQDDTRILAYNMTSGEELDVAILDWRVEYPQARAMGADQCKHANYRIDVELAALYPSNETTAALDQQQQQQQQDVTLAKRGEYLRFVVVDREAPVFSGLPAIFGGAIPGVVTCAHDALRIGTELIPRSYAPVVRAYDSCAGPVPVSYSISWAGLPSETIQCPNRGSMYMNWYADDGCGNIARSTQVVRVLDMEPPKVFDSAAMRVCATEDMLRQFATPPEEQQQQQQQQQQIRLGTRPVSRICLGGVVTRIAARAFRDNCDAIVPEYITPRWPATVAFRCPQPRGLRQTHLDCTPLGVDVPLGTAAGGDPHGCLASRTRLEDWTQLRVPVRVRDACDNFTDQTDLPSDQYVQLWIVPNTRLCSSFGYTPLSEYYM